MAFHAGMGPRPFEIFQNSVPSLSSCTVLDVQSAGFGLSAAAAAPSPFPPAPWQVTQFICAPFLPCAMALAPAETGFLRPASPSGAVHGPCAWTLTAPPAMTTPTRIPRATLRTMPHLHPRVAA